MRFAFATLLLMACRTPVDMERDYAKALAPPGMTTTSAPNGLARKAHTLRVHVYADANYQEKIGDWEAKIRDLVARAEAVVGPPLAVSFVVTSVSTFSPGNGASLEQALVALEKTDSGSEGDLIVGMLSPLPVFTTAVHELGRARAPGRHFVMRSMDSPAEYQAIERGLRLLDDAEHARLYRQRKDHKEVSVFLHEWAHTLGAVHGLGRERIMNPEYHTDASSFSRVDLELLGIALAHFPALLKDQSEMLQYKHETSAYLQTHAQDGAFEKEALNAALAWLGSGETFVALASPLPDRQATWLREAKEHADRGRYDLAQQALSLIFDYENHPDVVSLGCRVALAVEPKSEGTREKCQHAVERSPSDPMAMLMRAQTELLAGDSLAGAESLVRTSELVDRVNTSETMWDYFATLAQSAGCIGLAEKAARNAGADKTASLQAWAALSRRRAAIPVEMDPVRECRMQAQLTPVLGYLAAKRWKDAEGAANAVLAAFADAAAPLAVLCEAMAASARDLDAEPMCKRALVADPEAASAHYWLGVIEWRRGDKASAALRFSRALELDPEASHAAEMLRRAGAKAPIMPAQAATCETLVESSASFAKSQRACGLTGLRTTREACRVNIVQCSSADLTALETFAACFVAIPGCSTPNPTATSAALNVCGTKLKAKISAACLRALQSG